MIVPGTIVCDHGMVYMSQTFRNACRAMGISFQPTHKGSPFEKGNVEASFGAMFVAEVRRTIDPDYAWNPYPYWRYVEPLARTLLEEREDAEGLATLAEYRRTHGRPEPPSEIIESGELCQDN